ncbi:DtxR family Mn-dependent transcriptional regulator [Kineococcus radiotolerans]|uniref:DtxR family Mn-dependent transcriptional regulator n=1 Tax=Kineococcus radiotolerans TaxID=131568 RepID=A0A7W4TMX9_KINRA|nr:metal-dependent transcriptional regulator [Kineococcus radiotolerans]MBB2901865.1 DtxR family Mn-dependent transcriptional regulator [Kineococcus radiotolerans]
MSDLIDTTEMYLKTVFELEEEGIVPMRARIAERLHHSGPTVSQTVARMERDGLLHVGTDRRLELTEAGEAKAMRVMRKHRLTERLLTDVIGLEWSLVHEEACRWEHVVSEEVEKRLVAILDHPHSSPYGNPIPGLAELGEDCASEDFRSGVQPLTSPGLEGRAVVVRRLGEPLQTDVPLLARLHAAGLLPGAEVVVTSVSPGVAVSVGGAVVDLTSTEASHVFVAPA